MNSHDFENKILSALNEKAEQHQLKHKVIDEVFSQIEYKHHQKHNRWAVGFALAAAITGISIVPSSIFSHSSEQNNITVANPKLSPQLADDLDMLLVLGEDSVHGS